MLSASLEHKKGKKMDGRDLNLFFLLVTMTTSRFKRTRIKTPG